MPSIGFEGVGTGQRNAFKGERGDSSKNKGTLWSDVHKVQ